MKRLAFVLVALALAACTKEQAAQDAQYVQFAANVACVVAKMVDTKDAAVIAQACGLADGGIAFVESVISGVAVGVERDRETRTDGAGKAVVR